MNLSKNVTQTCIKGLLYSELKLRPDLLNPHSNKHYDIFDNFIIKPP